MITLGGFNMEIDNILNESLLEKYMFNKDNKLIEAILKSCYTVFDNINENGERDIYRLSDLEIDNKYVFSFLLVKDNMPVSSHSFSIENIYEFEELNKIIVESINS
ncbi:hypothetical protein [Staphylococcus phage LY01]|nr:hypothetical protein [Staphylococcus phage LY01]